MARSSAHVDDLRARLAAGAHIAKPSIIVADDQGLITHVDPDLARSLGWRVDELVDRPLTTIIPRRFRDAHHLGFSRFLTTRDSVLLDRPLALWIATKDGKELRVEHFITALRLDDGWLFGAAIRTSGAETGAGIDVA